MIFICLIIGFLLAWFIKPLFLPENQTQPHLDHDHPQEIKSDIIWTCSMDPQVRQSEAGKCPIFGMDLIPLETDMGDSDPTVLKMTEDAVKLAQIKTTVVSSTSSPLENVIRLNGRVKADETKVASIVTHIPGRIERLYINFTGDYVKKGQKIAEIYSPELIAAQRELIEAKKFENINPGLLQAVKNRFKYWKIPVQEVDRVLQSQIIQENFDIYADHSGIIKSRKVAVGDHFREGEVLFEVQDLSRDWVQFDVYEEDIPRVKLGDNIEFTTTAIPGKKFSATVSFIDPTINAVARVSQARSKLPDFQSEATGTLGAMIGQTIINYLELKAHLVQSDLKQAQNAMKKTMKAIEKIQIEGLRDDAANFLERHVKSLKDYGGTIFGEN